MTGDAGRNRTPVEVLITEFLDQESVAGLSAEFPTHYDPTLVDNPDNIVALAHGVRALVVRNRTQVRGRVLDAFDKLEVIGRLGVGLDNIDVDACAARGIEVCPATGANAVSVAEWTIAAILVGLRNVWQATPAVLAGNWPRNDLMLGEVSGKRLGLVGFGSIARLVASRARAFDMDVVACDQPGTYDESSWQALGVTALPFETLIATADVISVHTPLLPATRHLIDTEALARMKPSALLINSSRGGVIDEAALREALRTNRLGGAVLDVFEREPLPAGSAFDGIPNLLLTPHISGVTVEANRRVSAVVVAAVQSVLRRR
jgi:(S)-sulfolactate dehydrogenase